MSRISEKQLKSRLKELICVCGGIPDPILSSSVEDMLGHLEVLAIYRRFDVEATRRELKNTSSK